MKDSRLNRYRTALDIRDTPYMLTGKSGIIFHFSTETEMKNFQKKVDLCVRESNFRLRRSYQITFDTFIIGEIDAYNRTALKAWCIEYGGFIYDSPDQVTFTDLGLK